MSGGHGSVRMTNANDQEWWVGTTITWDVAEGDYFLLFGNVSVGDDDYDHDLILLTVLGDTFQRKVLALASGTATVFAISEAWLVLQKMKGTVNT